MRIFSLCLALQAMMHSKGKMHDCLNVACFVSTLQCIGMDIMLRSGDVDPWDFLPPHPLSSPDDDEESLLPSAEHSEQATALLFPNNPTQNKIKKSIPQKYQLMFNEYNFS